MKTTTHLKKILLLFLFSPCIFLFAEGNGDKNTVKYKVTAIKNGDNSIISESNIVEVYLPLSIYIPNAFTPNDDGLNDKFEISGEGIAEFNMNIYNKWGEMIFESADIENGWDGTFGGEIAQDGVYVYNISLKTSDKKYFQKSGSITMIK